MVNTSIYRWALGAALVTTAALAGAIKSATVDGGQRAPLDHEVLFCSSHIGSSSSSLYTMNPDGTG